jgi:hypothetical protein
MINVITVQLFSRPNGDVEWQPMSPRPNMAAEMPSREAAEVWLFGRSAEYNAEGKYWCVREKDGHQEQRFVVRPATP